MVIKMGLTVLIVYYSRTGNTKFMAEKIAEGIQSAMMKTDVKVKDVQEYHDTSNLLFTDVILLGTPTYASNIAWPIKRFIDEILSQVYTHSSIERKLVSGFTSTGTFIDGKKCLQALNWAFEHSRAKIVKGLITENSEPKYQIEKKCKDFGLKILKASQLYLKR